MSSEINEANGHYLELAIISHQMHVLHPRSGCIPKVFLFRLALYIVCYVRC